MTIGIANGYRRRCAKHCFWIEEINRVYTGQTTGAIKSRAQQGHDIAMAIAQTSVHADFPKHSPAIHGLLIHRQTVEK